MSEGIYFDINEMTMHDGPGIRTTVFLKGCPLRCKWCHNPEGISPKPQLLIEKNNCAKCGKCLEKCSHKECEPFDRCIRACPRGLIRLAGTRTTARELAVRLKRLKPLLVDGGITISGGEPLMQPDFVVELLELLHPINTIVETSGYADADAFRRVAASCSVVYLDLKHADSRRHRQLTGVGNEAVLANLNWIKRQEKPFMVRVPLIPGCNDDKANLTRTAILLEGAKNLIGVELLPYNPYAGAKYKLIDMDFPLCRFDDTKTDMSPTEEFERRGINCKVL